MRILCHELLDQGFHSSSSFVVTGAYKRASTCPHSRIQRYRSFPSQKNLSFLTSRINCSATMSLMANMEDEKVVFDVDKASLLRTELRKTLRSGKTKSYEWRLEQLKSIQKMLDEKEKEIIEALQKDLSKPEFEAYVSEISMLKSSCKLAINDLHRWMIPERPKLRFRRIHHQQK